MIMKVSPYNIIDNELYDINNHAVEKHKQHVHNTARYAGINHKIRHEFNIGTSGRFRGYSAQMDDRLVPMPLRMECMHMVLHTILS